MKSGEFLRTAVYTATFKAQTGTSFLQKRIKKAQEKNLILRNNI